MQEFFEKLIKNIKNHDDIVIMTHCLPDLDGLGSAIVLHEILNKLNKKNSIVAPKKLIDKSLNKVIKYLENSEEVIPFKYEKTIEDKNSLLIVLDTQEKQLTECPELLETIEHKIIIDHHSKGLNTIKNAELCFLDENKSSTIEVLTEFLKYLDIKLDEKFYTIMLTGLVIDTNGFNLKTTPKTFKIASYLLENGADLNLKQEFLKEDADEVLNRYDYIRKNTKLHENVYLCTIDDRLCTSVELAKLADEMLKLEDVKVSLAVGQDNNDILISARSMGNIDVSKLMMKFGGGGHIGASAARISNTTLAEAIKKLKLLTKGD